jgi:hypothetical protein
MTGGCIFQWCLNLGVPGLPYKSIGYTVNVAKCGDECHKSLDISSSGAWIWAFLRYHIKALVTLLMWPNVEMSACFCPFSFQGFQKNIYILRHCFSNNILMCVFNLLQDFLGLVEKLYYLSGRYDLELSVGDASMVCRHIYNSTVLFGLGLLIFLSSSGELIPTSPWPSGVGLARALRKGPTSSCTSRWPVGEVWATEGDITHIPCTREEAT